MSQLLSERFTRLPHLQEQREQEYVQQARDAADLTARLDSTRKEAERVAIAEIERTKRMMESAIRQHPDWLKYKADMEEAGKDYRNWEQSKVVKVARLQQEMDRLISKVDAKAAEYDAMVSQQDRVKAERAQLENENNAVMEAQDNAGRELEALAAKEASFKNELETTKASIESFRRELNGVDEQIKHYEKEAQAYKQRQEQARNELAAFQEDARRLTEMSASLFQKQTEAERTVGAARNVKTEIVNELNKQRRDLQEFSSLNQHMKEQYQQAEQTLSQALAERERMRQQQQMLKGDMTMILGDVDGLQMRHEAVNQELSRLLNERREIEREIMEKSNEQQNVGEKIETGESLLEAFEDRIREAEQIFNRAKELMSTANADQARDRLNVLESELRKAEYEEGEAENLLGRVVKEQESIKSARRGVLDRIATCERELVEPTIPSDIDSLRNRAASLQTLITSQSDIINGLNDSMLNILNEQNSYRRKIAEFNAKVKENQERLKSLPVYSESSISTLNEDINSLNRQLSEINQQLDSLRIDNPHAAKLATAQDKEGVIRSACWDAVKSSPTPEIRTQLSREAEAVMRAEAAVACTKKQQEIREETEHLAKFHLKKTPRVVLDERAEDVMLSECTGRRPKHEIAGIVLDMCEQQHIQIA